MSRISIGLQLREERKRQNYKQTDIAKLLNCDRSVLSRIENGHYQGSLQPFEQYINLLGFELAINPIKSSRPTLDDMQGIYDDD